MSFGQQGATPQPVQGTPTAQFKGTTTTTANQSNSVTISKKPGEPQRVHDVAYYDEEIAKIDAHIAAIDVKIATVNSDPTEQALAQQNGWFQNMNNIKAELNQKKAELIQLRDNL